MNRDINRYREWKEEYLKRPGVKERIKERARKYYQKDEIKSKRKKDSQNKSYTDYQYKRRESNPALKFIDSLRNRQKQVIKGITSTTKGLGCNKEELKLYLENQFVDGMNFDNYGNRSGCWSIDHIIPLSSYQKDENGNWDVDSEYNKKLIHYTNLRPMWHEDNLKKSNILELI